VLDDPALWEAMDPGARLAASSLSAEFEFEVGIRFLTPVTTLENTVIRREMVERREDCYRCLSKA
jgi:hypothetical protein